MKAIFTVLCCTLATSLFPQSNINQTLSVNANGAAPDPSAQLDVSATDKGMLVPRMTSAQRSAIGFPATGLLIFDTTTGGFWFYNGIVWQDLSASNTITDTDGDTKVQVEESLDEDVIRFDLGGTENMVLIKNAGGSPRLELLTPLLNTFVGQGAGSTNTTGSNNTSNGMNAFFTNSTGSANTANGVFALFDNTTGSGNTATGINGLVLNTTGDNNTAIGSSALFSNTTGNNNTALGYLANVSAGNLFNATAIGYNAIVSASDKVRLGDASVTVIEGQVDWTFPSDARFKFNIHDDAVPGLAFIEKLRPVTYQFDTRKFDQHLMQNMPDSIQQQRMAGQDYSKSTALVQTGFLAQEVEQACKDLGFQFSGLHVPESEVDNYGLAYGSFVPLLVKAVQEMEEIRKSEIGKLKAENAVLKALLEIEKTINENQSVQLAKITAAMQGAGIAVEK